MAVLEGGACVEDNDSVRDFGQLTERSCKAHLSPLRGRRWGTRFVASGNDFAGGVLAWVASAGGDDGGAGSGLEADDERVGGLVDGCVEEVEQWRFQTQHNHLGLGVAPARVELEHYGPARRHHEADEEDAFEG